MTITLTPEQQKRLEAAVAAGQFASVEEAVRVAVDRLVGTGPDHGDLDWVKPYLDEARAEIAAARRCRWKRSLPKRIRG